MEATLKIELQPFKVPDFVLAVEKPGLREEGISWAQSYPLSDLDVETLEALCDAFRVEVFRKAGKQMPPSQGA